MLVHGQCCLFTRNCLILKKNDYFNAKISDLEKTADNLDAKTFWKCLKSMDGTKKGCPINLGGKLAAIVFKLFMQMSLLRATVRK